MILLLMLQKAPRVLSFSNWLIIGNDDLADKFGVDNITMEDFVNGELGEYSEGAKTAEKR